MKIVVKGLTCIGSATDTFDKGLEVSRIKDMVETSKIVDYQKTNYGSRELPIFDPIPYSVLTGECFMHKNQFKELSSGIKLEVSEETLEGTVADLTFNKDLKARDYQIPVINKLLNIAPIGILGLTLATGRGKTFTICKVISELNKRFFIYIKAEYVNKWIQDVKYYFNLEDDEIIVIQGNASLNSVLERDDFTGVKVFIIAMQTFKVYIDTYLRGTHEYPVTPDDFLKHIQTDVMLVDEGHEAFENIYRGYMVLAPNRTFILSATMYNIDERINKFMEELIPLNSRITDGVVNRHATVIGVQYKVNLYRGFSYESPFGYSHISFEKSIRRKTYLVDGMFSMYKAFIDRYYIKLYQPKDKLVLFFSTTVMCEMFISYAKEVYPDKKSSIYVQGGTFEIVESHDIVATTIKKMGSAIDVPNLTTVLQTVVVSSRTKNEQTIGRLRPMEGRELNYIFFNAFNIPKHSRNFTIRTSILEKVSDEVKTMKYNRVIGGE